MWETEITTIVDALRVAPDDARYLQVREDLRQAEAQLVAGTRHVRRLTATVPLGTHLFGFGHDLSGHHGLYLVREQDLTETHTPLLAWTPAETIEAHAAMPDLLAAIHAAIAVREARRRP